MHPKRIRSILLCICTMLLILISSNSFSQSVEKKNVVSFSVPIFYNSITVPRIRNAYGPRFFSGSRISFGLRLNYEYALSQKVYLKTGAGFFLQAFGVNRSFEDLLPPDLNMTTQHYNYSTIEWLVGGGYRKRINAKNELDLGLTYHMLYTFRQKYVPRHEYYAPTVTNNKYVFAHMINPSININRKLNDAFSFQYGITIPVLTRWRKDRRFDENPSEFNKPTFHIGATLGIKYHF